MSKRIKRVFSNSTQVLHLWANQSQSDARSANVFFEGDSCYSYGYHYKLGQLIKVKGQTIAVINSRGYSVTTAKHIRDAYYAASHMPRLYSTDLTIKTGMIETQSKLIDTLFDYFSKKSFWGGYTRKEIRDYHFPSEKIEEFNRLCDIVGMPDMRLDFNEENFIELMYEHYLQCKQREAELNTPEMIAKRDAEREKREAKKQALLQASLKEKIDTWLAGGQYSYELRGVYPRIIRIKGDTVETSGRAEVPLKDALRLLKNILASKANQGDAIGGFKFQSTQHDGHPPSVNNIKTVTIGCHVIDFNQAKEVLSHVL